MDNGWFFFDGLVAPLFAVLCHAPKLVRLALAGPILLHNFHEPFCASAIVVHGVGVRPRVRALKLEVGLGRANGLLAGRALHDGGPGDKRALTILPQIHARHAVAVSERPD